MTTYDLLLALDPWLRKRCGYLARKFPGLDVDEVYQRVVEEFLRNLERWLQQDPTVSAEAQAKTLLSYCLRHVETDEIRRRKRITHLPGGEDGPEIEDVAPPVAPQDDLGAATVFVRIRACTTPPCALCLLSLRLPDSAARADAERAKAWKAGGSKAIPREIEEAWGIFADGRSSPTLVADDIAWKDHVGVAWYTDGPPAALGPGERRTAAEKVERYANRATEDLRKALLAEEEG
jgi:hypothetical protein